jgi:hypothetical protein
MFKPFRCNSCRPGACTESGATSLCLVLSPANDDWREPEMSPSSSCVACFIRFVRTFFVCVRSLQVPEPSLQAVATSIACARHGADIAVAVCGSLPYTSLRHINTQNPMSTAFVTYLSWLTCDFLGVLSNFESQKVKMIIPPLIS